MNIAKKCTYYIKKLGILGILIILSSCTGAYLKSYDNYTSTSIRSIVKESLVNDICASFLDDFFTINTQAQIYCAKQNKQPVFTTKKFFTDCSLTHPIVYTFNCI